MTEKPGEPGSLYDIALRWHRANPRAPLPDDAEPDGGCGFVRRGKGSPPGVAAAEALDRHFADPAATPADLDHAVHLAADAQVHGNAHVTAAAERADPGRAHETGRWLVRHSGHLCGVNTGIVLLGTARDPADIPLIRTVGLYSDGCAALAVATLSRIRNGHDAILWLAERLTGWGRSYAVGALCRRAGTYRDWLLRSACPDVLDGYYAGEVATAAHLHAAVTAPVVDDELLDHTGMLLRTMSGCHGMGMTLTGYPPAAEVLRHYLRHVAERPPTVGRYVVLADLWRRGASGRAVDLAVIDPALPGMVRDVLDRPEWWETYRQARDEGDTHAEWLATTGWRGP
ncbi:hypothetical protein LX16_0456 [Stackebrandtia albiflava]|uniref:Uncharacterized protein n=1 Tax=Stackebrandtia albiflava TaxID=406432 RepID=A0A562VA54_9ACTN|nr:hypothetical protein [Stackebrandtia albiflava]TWJ14766.1 hypothetical protein LX16_0456 [Stackebrandtia albiflava]